MPTFYYTGTKSDGTPTEGTLTAENRFAVYEAVRIDGGTVLSVEEQRPGISFDFLSGLFEKRVKVDDRILFAKNLSSMLTAGLSLSRALSVIERQHKGRGLESIAHAVGVSVAKGSSLHESLEEHPKVFSKLFVSMVKAGEESGTLADALSVVGLQMERAHTLMKKVRGAMIYPAILVIAVIGIAVLMLVYIVPTLSATFADLGSELPALTRAIIGISDFLIHNAILSLILVGLFSVGVFFSARTKQGAALLGAIVLKLPIIGTIVQETYAARTARTLSSLLAAGVEVLQAIEITREVIGFSAYQKVLAEAAEHVQKGEPLSTAFVAHPKLYPILVGDMIAVGEETGAVAKMLREIATMYEIAVEQKTKDLSTIIEPLLMLFIGGVVGIFALAMIAPIYSITENIQ